jgi:hypothetical protein
MRALTWIVGILAIVWSGYWIVGARAVETAATGWFAAQNTNGMVGQYADLNVAGFPNRFDLTVTDLALGDPVTGLQWRTARAQVFAMTWKPWHIIATMDDEQRIDLPDQSLVVTTGDARASLVFRPTTDLVLSRLSVSATQARVASSLGWTVSADVAELHTRLNPTAANAHDVALDATNLAPDPALIAATGLPARIARFRIRATAVFSAPLDRNAAATQPRITGWRVDEGSILWGDLTVDTRGEVAANADGLAEGRIEFAVKGWRLAMPLLAGSGAVKPEVGRTIENLLAALAAQDGDPETLVVPLVFANGWATLGPLPLGPAPRLN